MIQREVLTRVFRIRYAGGGATAFTMEHAGVQFLVTAKHVFEKTKWPANDKIELLIEGVYKPLDVEIKYPKDGRIDIAVMKTNPYEELNSPNGVQFTSNGLIFGQDVYFLGFPFNYDSLLAKFPGSNSPVPFIKKACFSGMLNPSPSMLFLDGYNNQGFSGGPVCFKNANDKSFSIAGVISGYRYRGSPVFDAKTHMECPLYVKENTGIIEASDISFAVTVAQEWIHNNNP